MSIYGGLVLRGLEDISVEVAAALSKYKGYELDLSGIRQISKEVAACLAEFEGDNLVLMGLEQMDGQTALHLAPLENKLTLSTSIKLSKSAQYILHITNLGSDYNMYSFPDLSDITESEAYEISKSYAHEDILESLCRLPDSDGFLVLLDKILNGESNNIPDPSLLKRIGPRAASIIVESYDKDEIDLSGLEEIGPDVAGVLSRHGGGKLDLSGLPDISTEAARMLSGHSGPLDLSGLHSLSDQAAAELAKHDGKVVLGNNIRLSNEARAMLAEKGFI